MIFSIQTYGAEPNLITKNISTKTMPELAKIARNQPIGSLQLVETLGLNLIAFH